MFIWFPLGRRRHPLQGGSGGDGCWVWVWVVLVLPVISSRDPPCEQLLTAVGQVLSLSLLSLVSCAIPIRVVIRRWCGGAGCGGGGGSGVSSL